MPTKQQRQYMQFAAKQAKKHGIPVPLFFGMIRQESGWNQGSISSAGAIGLVQKMAYSDAEAHKLKSNWRYNIIAGAKELSHNLKTYKGNKKLALAAYNAGPGAVSKYGGVPPYAETQAYIPAVLKYTKEYEKTLGPGLLGGLPQQRGGKGNKRSRVRPQPQTQASVIQALAGTVSLGMEPRFGKATELLQPVQSGVTPIGELTSRVSMGSNLDPIPTPMVQKTLDLGNYISSLGGGAGGGATPLRHKAGAPAVPKSMHGTPQQILKLLHAATAISKKSAGYSKETARGPLSAVDIAQKLDCSLSVARALQMAGLGFGPKQAAPVSGWMAQNWGKPGKGKFLTMYANDEHVFIEFKIKGKLYRFDTSHHFKGEPRGPRLMRTKRSTEGFTARHYPGL